MWETTNSNPTQPIKLSSQSENREQQTINTISLCLFITLFQSSSRALKAVHFLRQGGSQQSSLLASLDLTEIDVIKDFQQGHKLSVGGVFILGNFNLWLSGRSSSSLGRKT